jgi:hypothetical protein
MTSFNTSGQGFISCPVYGRDMAFMVDFGLQRRDDKGEGVEINHLQLQSVFIRLAQDVPPSRLGCWFDVDNVGILVHVFIGIPNP